MPSPSFTYFADFIPDQGVWFETLWNELAWERRPDAPRREYWTNLFGRSYTYGRGRGERTYEPHPDHILIETARQMLADQHFCWLEGCFLNGYEGARDWLGWHADDDPGIDHAKPIAVITVGAARAIQFREVIIPPSEGVKGEFGVVAEQMLAPGSLLFMGPGSQFWMQHRIPKANHKVDPRISLTFRGLRPLPESAA